MGASPKADAAARSELQRLIDTLQDERFRRVVKLEVPERPTGLPASYDIHVYGTYTDRAQRIELHVRDEKATAEFASTHRYARRTGELLFERVDQLTRELLYGAMTRHVDRADPAPDEIQFPTASRTASWAVRRSGTKAPSATWPPSARVEGRTAR